MTNPDPWALAQEAVAQQLYSENERSGFVIWESLPKRDVDRIDCMMRASSILAAIAAVSPDYLDREGARDLLHDGSTDDPNNKDCPSARVAPADPWALAIEALLPCPFCGDAVELNTDHSVGGSDWISHAPKPGGHDCPMEFSGFNVEPQSRLPELWNARALPRPSLDGGDIEQRARSCVADYYQRNNPDSHMAEEIMRDNWRDGASDAELQLVAAISAALTQTSPPDDGKV